MSEAATDIFDPQDPETPSDWQVLDFADAVSTVSDQGRRVKKRDYKPEGDYPVIDQGQDFVGGYTSNEAMLYEGELPVVIFGDHTLAVKYVDRPFAVGADGVKLLRPNGISDPKYLFYLLQSLRIPSRGYSRHFQFLKRFKLPVAPEDDQPRIVAEIEKQFSRLDEAVASLKRVKANLKRYKAAVLKAAVEGKLTEEWRKQNPDVEPASKLLERILAERRTKWEKAELAKMKAKGKEPKNDKWKEKYKAPAEMEVPKEAGLPETWVWSTLGGLGAVVGGLTKNQKRNDYKRHLPYLRVANVYANELRLDEIKEIGVGDNELDKLLLEKGDLLIVEGNGSPDQIGRLAIWDGSINPCVHQNHLIKVRLLNSVHPEWAVAWLLSPEGRGCIRDVASSTSGLYTLSVGKIEALIVPLPSEKEQERVLFEIERALSVSESLDQELDRSLRRAISLRQSILSTVFSGSALSEIGGSHAL